ncbi:hypothetical protein NL676_022972 [Syzygium grande]|nr:hypothetical protein NL676_022972 [Syzygium grande]
MPSQASTLSTDSASPPPVSRRPTKRPEVPQPAVSLDLPCWHPDMVKICLSYSTSAISGADLDRASRDLKQVLAPQVM